MKFNTLIEIEQCPSFNDAIESITRNNRKLEEIERCKSLNDAIVYYIVDFLWLNDATGLFTKLSTNYKIPIKSLNRGDFIKLMMKKVSVEWSYYDKDINLREVREEYTIDDKALDYIIKYSNVKITKGGKFTLTKAFINNNIEHKQPEKEFCDALITVSQISRCRKFDFSFLLKNENNIKYN